MKDINIPLKKISVIGGNRIEEGSDIYNMALLVGKNIAKNGAVLICGGLSGVMEAACKGAREEGGLTIGILPSTDEDTANKWVDIKIPTGLGYARNSLVVLCSHAVIAINGAEGTLSEIGYALTFKKPLIGLDTWSVRPYRDIPRKLIKNAGSPEEAVVLALNSINIK